MQLDVKQRKGTARGKFVIVTDFNVMLLVVTSLMLYGSNTRGSGIHRILLEKMALYLAAVQQWLNRVHV